MGNDKKTSPRGKQEAPGGKQVLPADTAGKKKPKPNQADGGTKTKHV